MKSLIVLIFVPIKAFGWCQAPSSAFLESKLKESFQIESGERELKELVSDPKNYALREDVKSLDRRIKYSNRMDREQIAIETKQKFDQMIAVAGRGERIDNFPVEGAVSVFSTSNNAISLEQNNLSKEDLDVLPPRVLDKLSNKVKIEYQYPYDKFEYIITYDGREMPFKRASNKIQNDFEDACEDRVRENEYNRFLQNKDREMRGMPQKQYNNGGQQAGGSSSQ